jgi:hypothetical protein
MENINLISENSIIESVITLMEQVEGFLDMDGLAKKTYVLTELKTLIGNETYGKYYFFIQSFIDFTIKISKGKIKLNLNNIKKKYCCF